MQANKAREEISLILILLLRHRGALEISGKVHIGGYGR